MMKWLTVASAAVIALCATNGANAQTELKYGTTNVPGGLQYLTGEEFTRRANERLPDEYKVGFYHSSQLGNDKEMMQKLKLGTIMFSMPSSIWASVIPEFGLFDMPFLVGDRAHLSRIENAIVWPTLAPLAEEKGYKIIAFVENGFRQITNNVRPIVTPDDLKGVKIRTPRSVWRVKMFETYGGNPTPMSFSEVFVALQTGTLDGQENPLSNIYGAKFQEVQKYLSISNHVYSPSYITVGKKAFEALPQEVQDILYDTARGVEEWAYATGDKQSEELLGKLKEGGMEVNVSDRAAFVAASKPVYEAFAEEVPMGKELIDTALSLAD